MQLRVRLQIKGHEFDPGPVNYFRKIDHGILSMAIFLPSADLLKTIVVSYKGKHVHEIMVNRLLKHAQEKNVNR